MCIRDSINRAIKKASDDDKTNYENIMYEGYGPSGVAVMVETLTDNRNRTASNLRHAFDKFGACLLYTSKMGPFARKNADLPRFFLTAAAGIWYIIKAACAGL